MCQLESNDTRKTRSSERIRVAYFPVTLTLKEIIMAWTDRQAKA